MNMKKQRKKIGLALGSGGLRGLAHIGVIKVLERNNIPIDFIAGTSSGAIVGGIYAQRGNISDIEKLAQRFSYRDLINIFFDPKLHLGLVKGQKAQKFLENFIGDTKIEDLRIPFRAVASDLYTGEVVTFDKGKLSFAIRASSCVPFIFEPMKYNGHYLIDGGTSQPVPVKTARKMGADIVIAVNLDTTFFSPPFQKRLTIVGLLRNSVNLLRYHLAKENVKEADIVINPGTPDVPWIRLNEGKKMIALGEKAAEKVIPLLKKLL